MIDTHPEKEIFLPRLSTAPRAVVFSSPGRWGLEHPRASRRMTAASVSRRVDAGRLLLPPPLPASSLAFPRRATQARRSSRTRPGLPRTRSSGGFTTSWDWCSSRCISASCSSRTWMICWNRPRLCSRSGSRQGRARRTREPPYVHRAPWAFAPRRVLAIPPLRSSADPSLLSRLVFKPPSTPFVVVTLRAAEADGLPRVPRGVSANDARGGG